MTELLHETDAPSDAELISRVRGGDVAAYGELFSRHVDAARRLARQLVRGPDADDLVSDAFAKVLSVLQGGGGPDVAFRAYLLTAVRRLHVDRIRSGSRLQTSDDMEMFDPGVPFQDTAVAAFESGAAAKAFASLPERWQLVLWHLEVEGQKPADIAPLLGMSPNSVSALAYRAREGLRQAFLTMHLADISESDCRWANEHLGAFVRNGLSKRDAGKVQSHLDECRRCSATYLELAEVNSNLRGIIAPLLLGAAAAGYLSSTGAAAGGGFGLVAMFDRAREVVAANAGAATAGAVAAGVAAVATAGIMLLPSSSPDDVSGAGTPIGVATTPGGPNGQGSEGPGGEPGSDLTDGPEGAGETEGPDGLDPSEPASASESPAATDGSSPAGEEPTGEPGDGTTAPGEPTEPGPTEPGPTEPGPTEPGPTEPGPTEPGPTEPGPTEPGPTEPGPTEPGPTEPGPTEPGPTEPSPPGEPPPPPPPPVRYTLDVGVVTLRDGELTFDLSGNPLPPTVYLDIESSPAGVTFDANGGNPTCRVEAGGLSAECSLATDAPDILAPAARVAAAVVGDTLPVSLRLTRPARDALVTVVLSAPRGSELARFTQRYDVPEPDLSLAGFPLRVAPTNVHDYLLSGTLGLTDYTGGVAYTVSDVAGANRVRFGEVGLPGCTRVSPARLECGSAAAGPVQLPLYVQDNRTADTDVRVAVSPLSEVDDVAPENNSVAVTLERYVPPPVDLVLRAEPDFDGNAGKGTVTLSVTGAPAGLVELTGGFDPVGVLLPDLPAGCELGSGGVVCTLSGPDVADVTFAVELVDRPESFTTEELEFRAAAPEFDETDESDNLARVTLTRLRGTTSASGVTARAATEWTAQPSATPTVAATLKLAAETIEDAARAAVEAGTGEPASTATRSPRRSGSREARPTRPERDETRPARRPGAETASSTAGGRDRPDPQDPAAAKPGKRNAGAQLRGQDRAAVRPARQPGSGTPGAAEPLDTVADAVTRTLSGPAAPRGRRW